MLALVRPSTFLFVREEPERRCGADHTRRPEAQERERERERSRLIEMELCTRHGKEGHSADKCIFILLLRSVESAQKVPLSQSKKEKRKFR